MWSKTGLSRYVGGGVVVELVGEGGGGINPPTTAMGEYGYLLEQQHLSLKQIKNNTTRVQRKSVLPPAIRASRS